MKVYVVKYWLTKGILEKWGEMTDYGSFRSNDKWQSYFHRNQFFLNREDAVKRVEQLRQKKIETLQGQIKKIQELEF